MSPIRKSDDYRAREISSWDEYVQDELRESVERGEFDNLPDQGKPIKIWQTDVNPEYDLAFSRLKNAGVKPVWMELDHEIGMLTEQLWAQLDRVEADLRRDLAMLAQPTRAPGEVSSGWFTRIRAWFRQDFAVPEQPRPTMTSILAMRERERERFMLFAAELDKKIVTYHESLPQGGQHLQRLRWLPSRAAGTFDDRIQVATWWEDLTDA